LKIQYGRGLGIATHFIFCYFIGRLLPGIHAPAGNFELSTKSAVSSRYRLGHFPLVLAEKPD
jgi:hypothetical protein